MKAPASEKKTRKTKNGHEYYHRALLFQRAVLNAETDKLCTVWFCMLLHGFLVVTAFADLL